MRLRENAWQRIQEENERRRHQRAAKIELDDRRREKRVKEILHPPTTQEKQAPVKAFLSVGKIPKATISVISKSSQQSVPTAPAKPEVEPKINQYFPKAKNRREAFRAYVAKHLLRIKARLVFQHRVGYPQRDEQVCIRRPVNFRL